jgi:hypothetical protein
VWGVLGDEILMYEPYLNFFLLMVRLCEGVCLVTWFLRGWLKGLTVQSAPQGAEESAPV